MKSIITTTRLIALPASRSAFAQELETELGQEGMAQEEMQLGEQTVREGMGLGEGTEPSNDPEWPKAS